MVPGEEEACGPPLRDGEGEEDTPIGRNRERFAETPGSGVGDSVFPVDVRSGTSCQYHLSVPFLF